ncbi:class I SAM-dependent methyltransferase [Kibdelosporangium phytohabitans]|uniref:Methyltransferase n=1 Tax=Kibdelosporangium phytohabitans TaxID=860235 RepID=A0A0N7F5U2_9PSEU|nr:class I SAM-dependent methyltransferase [Kibdelosporangium phytohabitans]ALG15183.1 methyltransferase [Kibdelosporangium phytohabitans]MBE1461874.1 SAM-dependent methyltransferase [Kibdelosporangium phytohabitans]
MNDALNATADTVDPVAYIFNSAVAASAIGAAWELGILDALQANGTLELPQFAAEHGLDPQSTLGLARALAAVDIVERIDTKVMPGGNFADAYRNRSFFHWLTRGSAELFRRMPDVARTANRTGEFYQRDAAAIAYACKEISELTYDPWFWDAIDGLASSPAVVADLGCGSGTRILQLLDRFPAARALGIDVAEPALAVAADATAKAGLTEKVTLIADDVLTMAARPEFAEVELLTCFMMGHDFWPRQRCVATLRRVAALFPSANTFLLGDATRSTGVADKDLPVFALGFELAHDLMGTFIPTIADWESVFAEGGWRLREQHRIGIAVGEVIFELERA